MADGTFIVGTTDGTVTQPRYSTNRYRTVRLEKTVVPIGHDWQRCVDHRLEKTVVSSGTTNHRLEKTVVSMGT